MIAPATTPNVGSMTVASRWALSALAWLFVAGALGQVFLAGLSLFESASFWLDHENLGFLLILPALLIPVAAVLARAGRILTGTALAVTILYIVQITLPNAGGVVAALHPVNALALIGLSGYVAVRSLTLARTGSD